MRRTLGTEPVGLWPSEGSVSNEVLALASEQGFQWAATDNGVLGRTLEREPGVDVTYQPYEWQREGRRIKMLFRDHYLSDLIGFEYSRMDASHAADHFLDRIRHNAGGRDCLVPIILDGENAWEHYADGGRPFLRALYGRLQAADDIRAVTMREAVATPGPVPQLAHLVPGSWIHADFSVWAGHEEDRRAWTALARARGAWERQSALVSATAAEEAYESLLAAEGSDWFWWYGDDHSSSLDAVFDGLFRTHLRRVYEALGLRVPEVLQHPLGGVSPSSGDGAMSRGW